jgi:serine/threonine protein kinase
MPRQMHPENWQKVKRLFASALEQSANQRTAFLDQHCDDEFIRSEVESLLAASDDPDCIIEKNALDLSSAFPATTNQLEGKKFGSYKIIREIGSGGMGAVFLAERADGQFQQQVALKIIRQSLIDAEIERHFRRERQILASLSHPNIARLLDGGVSASGEPFIAMEYVEGRPLMAFVVQQALNVEERLKLFLKVCQAVAFAHRNLVIHRDLKPSNIIVGSDGEPKLLDFGLARMVDFDSNNNKTMTAQRAFTPAYASPEQLRGQSVTTASDIYSLGVVLYELLAGRRPFSFKSDNYEEILRTVCETEPKPPSVCWHETTRARFGAETVSEDIGHQLSAPQPSGIDSKSLHGDLDTIVLMALRKEPERRYPTVDQFANDIERHLEQLPITARPNTFRYRATKFLQRNKIAVTGAAMILVTLCGGLAVSLWQYQKTQREVANSKQVRVFLEHMLLTANPESGSAGKGYSTTISDLLDRAARRLESADLTNQPDVRAELQQIVGASYLNQGQFELAEKYLDAALVTQTELFGENSPKLLKTQLALASFYLGKADYDNAERIFTKYLPLLREENQKGNIEDSFLIAALNNYAVLRRARGDSRAAEALYRENLAIGPRNGSAAQNDTETLLALTLLDQGKFDAAETLVRQLANRFRQMPNNETPYFANSLTLLGSIMMENGNLSEATKCLQEAEAIYRKLYGPTAMPIFDNLRLQAQVNYLAGHYSEALTQIDQVLQNYHQHSSPKYISFATALTVQGLILNKLGRSDEGERILREAVKLREENLPSNHFMSAMTKGALGEVLTTRKNFPEAETLLRESYEALKVSQAGDNQRMLTAKRRLAELYTAQDKPALAANYR